MGFAEYALKETRFKTLATSNPERSKMLLEQAQKDVDERWAIYEALASEAFAPKKKA